MTTALKGPEGVLPPRVPAAAAAAFAQRPVLSADANPTG
eukprot:CAMPEP_0198317290 /NCGR_PEP_ID=MMETSP1450-20131203/6811_1 /TAXON_ID=753684 ORGANISM="Madagascaria erythrocladiodes, Strain CCMP3234" /NCGR_SAMPLE_ID=MMETSP1450 /ASSEMBLY_ACC=CAM_ASM_001115 /LENGTH=38 /DNA_ID= /DNA_START= /DNA_END= /DNA_ORIENTATION=